VQVLRNGLRSVAYGRGQSGVLDLRFMAANADIQKGDALVTSGIDGVYPPGLSVASVLQVETKSTDAFAHIVCLPSAGIDRHKQLLILLVEQSMPPRPEPEGAPEKGDKLLKRRLREGGKDAEERAAPAIAATAATTPPASGAAATPVTAAPAAAANTKAATPATPATTAPAHTAAPAQPAKSTR
jgi:rod shape-determining protein MreC